MIHHHPRLDDYGNLVVLRKPSKPTLLHTWSEPHSHATVTPGSAMPEQINGIAVRPWADVPRDGAGWNAMVETCSFDEPAIQASGSKPPASGAVVVESDGRVWVVSPSNGYGGYVNTFPKGKLDAKAGLGLRSNALKEVFEESGLQAELIGFLCDAVRNTSVTRFYLARRLGGNPAAMDWESQAVHLVPQSALTAFVTHPNDQPVIKALKAALTVAKS